MNDDGGWGFDPLFGFLIGWLLASNHEQGRSSAVGHQHGSHWHSHVLPPGSHVHDGGLNGPVRLVPPTPEELAEQARRRDRARDVWGLVVAILAVIIIVASSIVWGLVVLTAAGLLSPTMRTLIGEAVAPVREEDVPGGRGSPGDPGRPVVVGRVDVYGGDQGRTVIQVEGWAQATADAALITVEVYRGEKRVGHAEGRFDGFTAGEPVAITLLDLAPYTGHDRVAVDSTVVPTR